MADNKTIHYIPPLPPKREKHVGIYCRVSTNSADQLKSLTTQVSALTRLTAANPKWLLVNEELKSKVNLLNEKPKKQKTINSFYNLP
jgi:predicted site-specific integrase-resolvase